MNFAHPAYLLAGMLACGALLLVWRRYDARQRVALETLLAPHLRAQLTASVSMARRISQRVLFGAAIALLFIALAAPQGGFRWEQTTRRGNDIMFAVDTSRSMLTPDVKPTRLARAKMAIEDFVGHLDGDAVGLVAFAGTAFLQTPMTLDYGAFHESLSALDTHIIPVGGTNISSAIRETAAALRNRPGSDKILILVTDGEDLQGDALGTAKAAAKQDGLKIFTVGVGTANGDLIPLPPEQGGGFLKDADGQLVKSHLDESGLRALAAATGGSYAPLGNTNQGLEKIYQEALAPLAKHELQARAQRVYTQLYQWPLTASLALLLCSLILGTRRRVSKASMDAPAPSLGKLVLPTAAVLIFAVGLLPFGYAQASPASAIKSYDSGKFADAEHEYSKAVQNSPHQPLLQFDAGAAAYKAGDYPQATQSFQASLNAEKSGSSRRLAEQEDAYYNLGNSLYREGQKSQQSSVEETLATWGRAVKAYDAALQLRTDDADSKFNRDLVRHKIDALKKQQQQPQKPQQKAGQGGGQSQQSSPQKPSAGQQSKSQSAQDNPGKGGSADAKDKSNGDPSSAAAQGQPPQKQGEGKSGSSGGKDQSQSGNTPQSAGQPAQPGQSSPPDADRLGGSSPRGDRHGDANKSAAEQAAQAADDQRAPGQMSRAEARQLLDSVKDEQQRLPAAPLARSGTADSAPSDEPLKDW
jgi:Ca-activated chloride channel family protein